MNAGKVIGQECENCGETISSECFLHDAYCDVCGDCEECKKEK